MEFEDQGTFLCNATFQAGISKQVFWLCASQLYRPTVEALLDEGSARIDEYGWLCREMRESQKERMDGWIFLDGPWTREIREAIADLRRPFVFTALDDFSLVSAPEPWAFIWLPTFSSNPNILATVFSVVANALRKEGTIVDDILNERLPLPELALVSTSVRRAVHRITPIASTSSEASSTSADMRDRLMRSPEYEATKGKGGAEPKWDWPKIIEIAKELYSRKKWPRSHSMAAEQIAALCEVGGIRCPDVEYLRKKLPKILADIVGAKSKR